MNDAERHYQTWRTMVDNMTDEDWRSFPRHQGKLNRREIARRLEVIDAVPRQNTRIRKEIEVLEADLREKGTLPKATSPQPSGGASGGEKDKPRDAAEGCPECRKKERTIRSQETRIVALQSESQALREQVKKLTGDQEREGFSLEHALETGRQIRP